MPSARKSVRFADSATSTRRPALATASRPLASSDTVNRQPQQQPPSPPPTGKKGVPTPSAPRKAVRRGGLDGGLTTSSSGLRNVAERQLRLVKLAEQSSASARGADVRSLLATSLHSHRVDVKSLVADMDKSGDGVVTRSSFRQAVRKYLPHFVQPEEVDAHFNALAFRQRAQPVAGEPGREPQSKVSVSTTALRQGLKELQELGASATASTESAELLASKLRRRAAQAEQAAAQAETVEESEARLARMKEAPTASARLGALVLRQGPKVWELIASIQDRDPVIFSPHGGGGLPQRELFDGLRGLGTDLDRSELEGLLGAGSVLDASQVTLTLKGLQSTAAAADGDALMQAKTCAMLRRAFAKQHEALQKALCDQETERLTALLMNETKGGADDSAAPSEAIDIPTNVSATGVRAFKPASVASVVARAGACRSG